MKRVLTLLKELFTKNKKLKFIYLVITVLLCYLPSMCNHVKITTPSQDAYKLQQMAQCIESEEELRSLEVLCNEMENAYRNSYDGAMAIKFRLMTGSAIEEAGARREAFRTMEDAEKRAEIAFEALMADLDAAWQIEIASEEEAYKAYDKLAQACVDTHMAMRATMMDLNIASNITIENNYAQEYMDNEKAIKREIASLEKELAECNAEAKHYNLAYRLKFGKTLPNSILLEKYLKAFNGQYTRVNAGEGYGDVEYVIELLNLADSYDDISTIESQVIEVIAEKYRSDFKSEDSNDIGYDGMFLAETRVAVDNAYIAIDEKSLFEQLPADVEYFIGEYDAKWGCTTEQ
jgi:hypothetical protein